jgi:hypothetical protein
VVAVLPLEIARGFSLHGLSEGLLWGVTTSGSPWPARPECKLEFPAEFELPRPSEGEIELAFRARALVSAELRVAFPPGTEPFSVWAWFLREGAESALKFKVGAQPGERSRSRPVPIHLEPGNYRMLAHSVFLEGEDDRRSFYCIQDVTVAAGGQVIVAELEPAASVEGELTDEAGEPLGKHLVTARAGLLLQHPHSGSYAVQSNAQGSFVLTGLPPSTAVVFRDGTRVTTGGPGSTVPVRIREQGE